MLPQRTGRFIGCAIGRKGEAISLAFENCQIELTTDQASQLLPGIHQALMIASQKRVSTQRGLVQAQLFHPESVSFLGSPETPFLRIDDGLQSEINYSLKPEWILKIGSQLGALIRLIKEHDKKNTH